MKNNFYLLILIVVLSIVYGSYSTVKMLFNNRTPYSISCEGILLEKDRVYAISNLQNTALTDTIFVHFDNSASLMPKTLGFVFFDKSTGEFVLKNDTCIINPDKEKSPNPFFPYCHTLNDGIVNKGRFFSSNETISQAILCGSGLKYNIASGSTETRVAVEFVKNNLGIFLKIKNEGLKVKYPIENTTSYFKVLFNKKSNDTIHHVFYFANLINDTGEYKVKIIPQFNNVHSQLFSANNKLIKEGDGRDYIFTIENCLFHITNKYSIAFTIFYVLFLFVVTAFQFLYLLKHYYANSPIVKSIFAIRILINAIVFMAIPLFLTSYPIHDNRIWYLILLLVLNFHYFIHFIPQNSIRWENIFAVVKKSLPQRIIQSILFIIIAIAPFVFWKFSRNEAIFQIPIGHFQKAIIIILFYVTSTLFKKNSALSNFARISLIITYSFIISLVTSDLGSFIYACLAIVLIELVRKTLKMKWLLLIVLGLIFMVKFSISLKPSLLEDRKVYRIVAPYIQPDDEKLLMTNEGDRESYSTFIFTLKGLMMKAMPGFNDLSIQSNSRSTFHTDFAFLWSLIFGQLPFLIIYLLLTGFLLYHLLFLMYVSIRPFKISSQIDFLFPKSKEAEAIRFLLAFTLMSFIVPICSNLLLIPVTGVSIPAFSISWVEILSLLVLIIALEYIFNSEKYYVPKKGLSYHHSDMRNSVRWGLFIMASCFSVMLIIKVFSLGFQTPDTYVWRKIIITDNQISIKEIPKEKDSLIVIAKDIIGSDNVTSVRKTKRSLLKNLASLYYTDIPYNQTIKESPVFTTSVRRLQKAMTYDSIFSFKKVQISNDNGPFGKVYAFDQLINSKTKTNISNDFYTGYDISSTSINSDLHAECSKALQDHLNKIGIKSNIGSIMIVDNENGGILTSSSYPIAADINSKDIYYFIGSLKKIILAYAAVKINAGYYTKQNYGVSFATFIRTSNDYYAARLLKEIMQKNKVDFEKVLNDDFGLPLFSNSDDGFFDVPPQSLDFTKELDRNNSLYRIAIGQEKPYRFIDVIQWYCRIASLKKLKVSFDGTTNAAPLSISENAYATLVASMNSVILGGTASKVGSNLKKNKIPVNEFICKTGTAEAENGEYNSSSSFVIANKHYTIGVMLRGHIPHNDEGLAAKDLFSTIIPILKNYQILHTQ